MKINTRRECPYYPCSFPEQDCTFCYCPLYPCRVEGTGGKYIKTKIGFNLWSCEDCKMIHTKEVVKLLNIDINETDERKIREAREKLKSYIRGE